MAWAAPGKYPLAPPCGARVASWAFASFTCDLARMTRVALHVRSWTIVAIPLLAAGCAPDPIVWDAVEYVDTRLAADAAVAPDEKLCGMREIGEGVERYRAGWDARSGALTVMRSGDGGLSWEEPVIPDSRQSPEPPCRRPPPSLFADSANGFLHVAYFSEVSGGAGVYYVHSMDAARLEQVGPGMFEQPVALTYGRRAARTSVASRGDTVVVAYEDPNSARGGIQLAVSSTAGHSFEGRVPLPGGTGVVAHPRVALTAGRVTVTWREVGDTSRALRRSGSFR